MAKQRKMRFYDPPIESMKKSFGSSKEDPVEPIRERSREMARSVDLRTGKARPRVYYKRATKRRR